MLPNKDSKSDDLENGKYITCIKGTVVIKDGNAALEPKHIENEEYFKYIWNLTNTIYSDIKYNCNYKQTNMQNVNTDINSQLSCRFLSTYFKTDNFLLMLYNKDYSQLIQDRSIWQQCFVKDIYYNII